MKIHIIGCSCSGKTTLAKKISRSLKLKHIELDYLAWESNWTLIEIEEFREKLKKEIKAQDNWVIDGNYRKVRDIIWDEADTVIFLNYSFWTVMSRAIKRTFRRVFTKEEVCNGNVETFKIAFLSKDSILYWVYKTHKLRKKEYPVMLEAMKNKANIIIVNNPKELKCFDCWINNKLLKRSCSVDDCKEVIGSGESYCEEKSGINS